MPHAKETAAKVRTAHALEAAARIPPWRKAVYTAAMLIVGGGLPGALAPNTKAASVC